MFRVILSIAKNLAECLDKSLREIPRRFALSG